MAANTSPIYTRTADIQYGTISAANTAKDGTGTVVTAFTADATEGGYVTRVRFMPLGTNVATVARIWINNGSSNATPANNTYWDSITLPATTNSEVAALAVGEVILDFPLPAGYKINVTLGTAVSAGYGITVIGGKY